MSLEIGFASQTPSLPSSGGAGGLGETFAPDLSTGTGTMAIPIDLPNGPNDCGPKLALRYDSGTPNGPFGLGWSIALPRLIRSTMVGRPRFDDSDTLVLEGSGPLVRSPDGALHPQVDTGEWRIVASGEGFVCTDRAGTRFHLGTTPDSRIVAPSGGTWAWLIHEIEDNLDERTTFSWRAAGSQRYLDDIAWGPFELRFTYEPRPDVLRWGRGGFLLRTDERCRAIELRLSADAAPLVRRWALGYASSPLNGASQLASITLTGFAADGTSVSAPTMRMSYVAPAHPSLRSVAPEDDRSAPPGLDGSNRVELVDWTGTGTADIVEFGAGGVARVWPNRAGRFGRPQAAGSVPALAGPFSRAGLIDVDGDGLADVVRIDERLVRYQPRTPTSLARTVTFAAAPSVAPGAPNVRLADLDGDGRTGMVWSNGRALLLAHRDEHGGWLPRPDVRPSTPDGPPTDLGDAHVYCADMTGDGTPDVVRVDGSGVTYWPYLGQGAFGDKVVMLDSPSLPFDVDLRRVFLVDVDGDGCADLVHLDGGRLRWWPNCSGARFEAERLVEHLPTGAMDSIRIADLLGTGSPSLCWSAPLRSGRARWFALDLLGTVGCSLLGGIDNGSGRTTTITWSTSARESERDRALGHPWTTRLPIVLPVVSEVAIDDATSGSVSLTRYSYHDGRYDGELREMCGFGRVDVEDVGDASIPTLVTTRWFHIGLNSDGSEPATTNERQRARAIRGRLYRQERGTADGYLFDRFEQDWRVYDGVAPTAIVPRLVGSTQSVFEGEALPTSRIVTEQLAWDVDGNVTDGRERSYAASPVPERELRTTTTYAHDPNGRYRQRIARVVQSDSTGAVLSDLRTSYDGAAPNDVGAAGIITSREALALTDAQVNAIYGANVPDFAALGYHRIGGEGGWWASLGRYQRSVDAGGIVGSIVGAAGGTTTLEFEATGCYPVRVTDGVGNDVRAEFDLRYYQPTALVDPSGARHEVTFDALARVVRVVKPGDSVASPTETLVYDTSAAPVTVTARHASAPGSPLHVRRQFVDGAGRTVQQRVLDDTGEVVVAATAFGRRGIVARSYLPFRATGEPYSPPLANAAHTSLHYDALGRTIRIERPDGAIAEVRYLPGAVEERDFEQTRTGPGATHSGAYARRTIDATGRIVRVDQVVNGSTFTSTQRYDIKGQLVEHVDAIGGSVRFDRDLLGRTIRTARPEATQVLVVDAAGNVVETRTGSSLVFRRFDVAGRPLAIHHGSPVSAPVAAFVYHDNGAPAPADAGAHTSGGRLVRVEDEGGVTTFDYDTRGRIARKVMTPIGESALTLEVAHRSDGLLDRVTYPGGRVVTYQYNTAGLLHSISGVIDSIEYDSSGRRIATAYSNGVTEEHTFDALNGWRESSLIRATAGVMRQVGFEHDLVGNVTAITSSDNALAWAYGYDDAYRLVSAISPSAGTLDYTYDAANNLTSSAAGLFGYGSAGAPASCLTSVGADTFVYDDRGQLVTAPWGTHTLDDAGRVRHIALVGGGSETMTFGHSGLLVRRISDSGAGVIREVVAPDPLVHIEDGQVVLQISDGDRIVARDSAGSLTWLHVDHLGSLSLVTDESGAEVLRIAYDPYGQILARTGATIVSGGFGAGEDMGHGLVLLGARWYAPRIGRFLSPDPLVGDVDDPAAWNAYAYCRCNPTSYVDPSGRDFWKIFAAVVATVVIIVLAVVVTVCTFGAAGPGAAALTVGGLSITWGAVFAATVVGVVAGGVIGGIAAARAGGNAEDIFLGIAVGGAVGGWAAFGASFAGVAVGGALGLTSGTVLCGAVVGGVSGTINGAAMGFASGFAGGKNKGIGDVMEKVLVGAIIGLAVGAALGALSAVVAPKESIGDASRKLLDPPPQSGASGPSIPSGAPTPPAQEFNTLGGAGGELAKAGLGKVAGTYAPYVAAWAAPAAANAFVRAILVDGSAAAGSAFFDDLQQYVRTHNVDLGPFTFLKSDW